MVLGFFMLALVANTTAQTAKIKTQYKSSGNLGTFPSNTFPIYSGNHTVAKAMKVYLTADTTGGVSSFTWAITSHPTGSSTTLSSTSTQNVTFVPDIVGSYIVSLSVGSTTDIDTFYVGTYLGPTGPAPNCSQCHGTIYAGWQQTPHANIFHQGVTGQLETATVNNQLVGTYGTSCIKCHTTGWDQTANNGNFGDLAHQSGFDTTWYKTYTGTTSFQIPTNDQTAWNLLTTNSTYSNAAPVANIGCESCHGPGSGHVAGFGDVSKISATLDAGVCLQCHEAPTHHMIGTYYLASNHATMPLAGTDATSTSCFPCHSGSAYYKYSQNQTTPGYVAATDASQPITCAVCHDPHNATNYGLRLVPVTLKNGYSVSNVGNGQLCMTCHQARKNINTTITATAPYYGFSDRFGPHHGPQSDMFLGQNAYQYGDTTITGINTHRGLTDACVTCHMQARGAAASNHQWNMSDSTGDYVTVCKSCHGQSITKFDDIKASSDWDGNGVIEGVQTEVHGMVNKLAALLPKDSTGAVVSMMADSLKVKGQPSLVKGIYTYYFVTSDGSYGVHNAKYTVAILQKALNSLGATTPVELTSFAGSSSSANQVALNWETVTEANNKGFEIQRKSGSSWLTEGFISGKGTSTNVTKYSFTDKLSNVSGSVTYRLKQVDMNGTFQYSKEIEVNVTAGPQAFALAQNYPNPFNPSTTIQYSLPYASNVKITIYNITGAVIKVLVNSAQETGVHQAIMNTASNGLNLSSGVYFYSIQAVSLDGTHSFRQTKKMILMK